VTSWIRRGLMAAEITVALSCIAGLAAVGWAAWRATSGLPWWSVALLWAAPLGALARLLFAVPGALDLVRTWHDETVDRVTAARAARRGGTADLTKTKNRRRAAPAGPERSL
jgi:hypothetical protein